MLVFYANGGIILPLFIGVHIEAKLALVQKSKTHLPFTKKGGDC